jgi:predicted GNAT family acetyltransferase
MDCGSRSDPDAEMPEGRHEDDSAWRVSRMTAVAGGSAQARGPVCELTGIATVPSWRRRGIGAELTGLLAADAASAGARIIVLSAGDETVARVYERAGFRRVGTACTAEPRGRHAV